MSSVHLPGVPDPEVIGIIPAGELAELGIAEPVLIIEPRWFDDRQICTLAQRYLHGETEATPAEWQACGAYRRGQCRSCIGGHACIFEEPASAEIWQRAQRWQYVTMADGSRALARREHAAEILAKQSEVRSDANSAHGRR